VGCERIACSGARLQSTVSLLTLNICFLSPLAASVVHSYAAWRAGERNEESATAEEGEVWRAVPVSYHGRLAAPPAGHECGAADLGPPRMLSPWRVTGSGVTRFGCAADLPRARSGLWHIFF
jgi:hypothetical protein